MTDVSPTTYIVVPCHRPRLPLLLENIPTWGVPRERVIVVTTCPDPIIFREIDAIAQTLIVTRSQHISEWQRRGIDTARALAPRGSEFEVLGLSSDVAGSANALAEMRQTLRHVRLSLVGPNYADPGAYRLLTGDNPRRAAYRITGGCWLLAGEDERVRPDTRFRWWYVDDDLEMQARAAGGAALVACSVNALPDTPLTAERARWAGEDRELFVEKWGHQPW